MQFIRPQWRQLLPNRLAQLWLLAATIVAYSVLAMAIGNSLFVSYVGAKHLPLAFMLIGLCSMPAYIVFSQVVDRYSRPKLLRYVLIGSALIALALWLLLAQRATAPYGYYALLIAVFFQWDFHNNVLYPSLLTDYFTTAEYKRNAPYIGIAQAVGALAGGGLTTVLAGVLSTRDLLLCLPILFGLGIVQLVYLESSQRQQAKAKSERPAVGILESLQTFPGLVKRYPLALFLAMSSFLLVIIYISSEFLWFSIYSDRFTDQALTGFLGLMRILLSAVQIAVIYGITRPLLKNLGIARLNPVYPLTTLISFMGLITHLGLPAAIGLHINGDALYKAINLPVHQLNYNAIPREFIGRIRTLSDGFIYAIGLTLAGALLWVCETHLNLHQTAMLVAGLTGLLLLVRLPMGRFYASGLEAMIRSNSINLDDLDAYALPLMPQSGDAVRELLTDSDRYTQLKGLELAARMNQPEEFLADVEALIPEADIQVYGAAVALYTDCPHLLEYFQQRLEEGPLQAFALEILLINQYRPSQPQIDTWLQHSSRQLRVLGAIAQTWVNPAATVPWTELDNSSARIVTRVVAHGGNPDLTCLIPQVVLTQASADVIRAGLEALLPLTQRGDTAVAAMALTKLDHPDPFVRIAVFDLLKATACIEHLAVIGESLEDADPRVRQRVASTLAAYGRPGLALAQAQLHASQLEVVNAAITAIGLVRTKYASNLLFEYVAPSYKQLARTRKWQQQIPPEDPRWQPLRVAIVDYHNRLIDKVLYILSALGHTQTVNTVNRLLTTQDQSELENALEVLASLNHRRFVMPLMPLLETRNKPESPSSRVQATPHWLRTKGYRLLLEALESKDRWLKTGALVALATIPSALVNDPDPVVKQVANQIFGAIDPSTLPTHTAMNRLLLLKKVALFKNLSLDELLLIDQSLEQVQVLAGETIFTEGDWGTHLYIIATGTVQLLKQTDSDPRELKRLQSGHYFGEVALFDDAPRWDGAIAATDCTLLKLGKTRFLSLVTQRPHIILEMCRFLSQRLRETDHHRAGSLGLAVPEIAASPKAVAETESQTVSA